MNNRERFFRAIKFESPDRLPVIHDYLPGALVYMHSDGMSLEIAEELRVHYSTVSRVIRRVEDRVR